ncbi:Sir2 family NAD-dependent protein deacetylase [Corynebacterium sp. TAE3-ERU30]|uniref:Sir2 family NAD-dependent protein deacetylase n=1 Tax=Corynebacterium sp. TAE3-ERU30 TaxID=2849496 RepID=UPI001C47B3F7|nr:Sir2 family NAD-dependent protein deacetylase [Corynebacterium sp. TAE3-ERU30]MBV7281292.1 NAD-dependent protein deacetylase [Corynebacterium sp. TAE3-ERU30]
MVFHLNASVSESIARTHASAVRSIQRVVDETAPPTPPAEAVAQIAELFASGRAAVLTGAGVSTPSGIPDYRGPQGSLARSRPMTYQEFRYDRAALHRYWARAFVGWRHMAAARPNSVHYQLVELEAAGLITGVITQNVDGLHRAAGSTSLVELHGDLSRIECLSCGAIMPRSLIDARLHAANPGYIEKAEARRGAVNPDGDVALDEEIVASFHLVGCPYCGSQVLKPHVIYFGEPVDPKRKAAAHALVEEADFLLVAGSSLAVMSGYRFAIEAQRAGKPVVVINGGPGRADTRAAVLWRSDVRQAFDAVIDATGLA